MSSGSSAPDPTAVPTAPSLSFAAGTTGTPAAPADSSAHQTPPHLMPTKIVSAPSGFKIHLVTSLHSTNWPTDLVLDLGKANWVEWSRKLSILALSHGIDVILNGRFPCPDIATANDAHYIWEHNDGCLRGFIQDHVSAPDLHQQKGQ